MCSYKLGLKMGQDEINTRRAEGVGDPDRAVSHCFGRSDGDGSPPALVAPDFVSVVGTAAALLLTLLLMKLGRRRR